MSIPVESDHSLCLQRGTLSTASPLGKALNALDLFMKTRVTPREITF